ncbi:hypothetical protein TGPRC2_426810, partial [Toxoplasma gondii TgCatPRC2]
RLVWGLELRGSLVQSSPGATCTKSATAGVPRGCGGGLSETARAAETNAAAGLAGLGVAAADTCRRRPRQRGRRRGCGLWSGTGSGSSRDVVAFAVPRFVGGISGNAFCAQSQAGARPLPAAASPGPSPSAGPRGPGRPGLPGAARWS